MTSPATLTLRSGRSRRSKTSGANAKSLWLSWNMQCLYSPLPFPLLVPQLYIALSSVSSCSSGSSAASRAFVGPRSRAVTKRWWSAIASSYDSNGLDFRTAERPCKVLQYSAKRAIRSCEGWDGFPEPNWTTAWEGMLSRIIAGVCWRRSISALVADEAALKASATSRRSFESAGVAAIVTGFRPATPGQRSRSGTETRGARRERGSAHTRHVAQPLDDAHLAELAALARQLEPAPTGPTVEFGEVALLVLRVPVAGPAGVVEEPDVALGQRHLAGRVERRLVAVAAGEPPQEAEAEDGHRERAGRPDRPRRPSGGALRGWEWADAVGGWGSERCPGCDAFAAVDKRVGDALCRLYRVKCQWEVDEKNAFRVRAPNNGWRWGGPSHAKTNAKTWVQIDWHAASLGTTSVLLLGHLLSIVPLLRWGWQVRRMLQESRT